MADEMLAGIASLRGEVREQLKAEFLADPQVAGALTALDKIKSILLPFTSASAPVSESDEIAQLKKDLADKDAKIAELEEENSKLADAAKEAGYKLYMERQIAGDPDASLIRKLVGDVTQLESAEALKTKLSSIREELGNKRSAEENRADNASESKSQKAKTEALEEALEKLTSANKAISLKLYAEKKLQGNPKSAKIRALIENARPSSKESVDSIFESFAPSAPHDSDEASAVRARVRKLTKGGFEAPLEEEVSEKAPPRVEDYNGLGINLGELKRLSGVQRK
jgi:DNA repair exonuclease SbcCD ATPase subunit